MTVAALQMAALDCMHPAVLGHKDCHAVDVPCLRPCNAGSAPGLSVSAVSNMLTFLPLLAICLIMAGQSQLGVHFEQLFS